MISRLLPIDKFVPQAVVDSVQSIDLKALQESGVKALIFDVDNTLIPYDDRSVKPWHTELFESLKALDMQTIMLTNNHHKEVSNFAKELSTPIIMAANKPLKTGYKKALKALQLAPSEVIMVGDQFMTDLYGASRVGMATILVRPIRRKSEKWYTKILRRLERNMKIKVGSKYPALKKAFDEIHDV